MTARSSQQEEAEWFAAPVQVNHRRCSRARSSQCGAYDADVVVTQALTVLLKAASFGKATRTSRYAVA